MKKLMSMLWVTVACLGIMASPASAEPAWVMNMGPVCFAPWASSDPAHPLVILQGVGILVDTNNAKGVKSVSCHIFHDYSQAVPALDFFTGEPVQVNLLSIDDTCAVFGISPCPRRGDNGTAMFNASNAGGECAFPTGGSTTDWRRHITPSGLDLLVCKFPARRPE